MYARHKPPVWTYIAAPLDPVSSTELRAQMLIAALPLPWIVEDFWTLFVTKVLILGLLAISFDLVWGYAGMMSFGQALFFGVAGYVSALIATQLEITSVLVLVPVAAVVGLVVAFLLAIIIILGKRPPSMVFVAPGTLTGSYVEERLARGWTPTPTDTVDGPKVLGHAACALKR